MSTGGPQRGELFGEDTLERTPTKKKKKEAKNQTLETS